jgi:K+/H+ antiporter YhaU regulatory subunit KhtT
MTWPDRNAASGTVVATARAHLQRRYAHPVRVHVEQTALPGIGVRHELVTESGRRVGVVCHRDGHRDLVLYDPEDPDSCQIDVRLTHHEAEAVADVLGESPDPSPGT